MTTSKKEITRPVQFDTEAQFKAAVSRMRKEMGLTESEGWNHTRTTERLASILGYKNYAHLKACIKSSPKETATPVVAVSSQFPVAPGAIYENEDFQVLEKYPHLLFNKGDLDLSADGTIFTGRLLYQVNDSLEDILYCNAYVQSGTRREDGLIEIDYAGETSINWDAQQTRKDARGMKILGGDDVEWTTSEDLCFIGPEAATDAEEIQALFKQPDTKLKVRNRLVQACVNLLRSGNFSFEAADKEKDVETALGWKLHFAEKQAVATALAE